MQQSTVFNLTAPMLARSRQGHCVPVVLTTAVPPAARRRQHAFTLIEILVVISIIALLVGLVAASFLSRQGPASTTHVTLAALKASSIEYNVLTGKNAVSMRPSSSPYAGPVLTNAPDVNTPSAPAINATIGGSASGATDFQNYSIARYCHQLLEYPTTEKMITSLPRNALGDKDEDRFFDVVDGWGNLIVYYNPETEFDSSADENYAHAIIFPPSRTPYFASAGDDGKWGDYRQLVRFKANPSSLSPAETTLANEAMDNDYSFTLGK